MRYIDIGGGKAVLPPDDPRPFPPPGNPGAGFMPPGWFPPSAPLPPPGGGKF